MVEVESDLGCSSTASRDTQPQHNMEFSLHVIPVLDSSMIRDVWIAWARAGSHRSRSKTLQHRFGGGPAGTLAPGDAADCGDGQGGFTTAVV
jgi:hypothetical protein